MSSASVEASLNREGWLFGRVTDLMVGCGLGYILSIPFLYYFGVKSGGAVWSELVLR
jgi:hypothetical protein